MEPADPAEPADEEGDVRAEDTAVAVRLVDDNCREPGEEPAPLVVPREDVVELVRVGEDDTRFLPYPCPRRDRRVPVVDSAHRPGGKALLEGPERPVLVTGERLGRVEKEERGARLRNEPFEDGEGERQRLSRCRRGRDNDVLPFPESLHRLALVCIQANPPGIDELPDLPGKRRFHRPVRRVPRRDLLCVDPPVPEAGVVAERPEGFSCPGHAASARWKKRRARETRSWQLCSTMGTSGPGLSLIA